MLGSRLYRVWRENWLLLVVVGAVLLAFLMLRTPASPVQSAEEVDAQLLSGQPTFIEFYSNA